MHYPDFLHHGAKDGVTGSCHQLLMDTQHSLLIDGGLFQGAETSAEGKSGADRLAIEFPLDTVKALIATHVHIDPVGHIPYLLVGYHAQDTPSRAIQTHGLRDGQRYAIRAQIHTIGGHSAHAAQKGW